MKGKKVPKKKKKDAMQSNKKAGSLQGRTKSIGSNFLGRGDNRDFTVRFAMTSMPKIMNATALIVHGNPILGMSFDTMIGNITPPMDDPEAITPKAVALFLKNHVPIELMAE